MHVCPKRVRTGLKKNPAAVSAAVNVASFFIANSVNTETDSAMLERFMLMSEENAILGAATQEKFVSDSPMVQCLIQTAGKGENGCAPGPAFVFFERKSMGKSSAARYFCRKILKNAGCRSIVFFASGIGGGQRYFQRMAALLGVEFLSNWGRCLVSAMTKSAKEAHSPFLILDEFNQGTEADLQDLDVFMRACQDLGFYLIIITSTKEIADKILDLNSWAKMRPLKFIHNGPTTNIEGQPGYNPDKKADWKCVNWTLEQLKKLVITKVGELDDYSFLLLGMTPKDAMVAAQEIKMRSDAVEMPTAASDLSADDLVNTKY